VFARAYASLCLTVGALPSTSRRHSASVSVRAVDPLASGCEWCCQSLPLGRCQRVGTTAVEPASARAQQRVAAAAAPLWWHRVANRRDGTRARAAWHEYEREWHECERERRRCCGPTSCCGRSRPRVMCLVICRGKCRKSA
jgi:hypothetical protein